MQGYQQGQPQSVLLRQQEGRQDEPILGGNLGTISMPPSSPSSVRPLPRYRHHHHCHCHAPHAHCPTPLLQGSLVAQTRALEQSSDAANAAAPSAG